jgi:hypothetical protein
LAVGSGVFATRSAFLAAGIVLSAVPLGVRAPTQTDDERPPPPAVRVVSIDDAAYPTVDSVVVVPQILSGQNLAAADFEVRQGVEPRPVEVERVATQSFDVALVIDPSIAAGREVEGALLELPVQLPGPQFAIVAAASPGQIVQPLTADTRAVTNALGSLPSAGTPALAEGVELALGQLPSTPGRRRVVAVVASAAAAGDPALLDAVADRAAAQGVAIHVVCQGQFIPPALARLARVTGGISVLADAGGMVAAVDTVAGDVRGQYRLRFQLTTDDPTATVAVSVTALGVTARARLPVPVQPVASPENTASPRPATSGADWLVNLVLGVAVVAWVAIIVVLRLSRTRRRAAAPIPEPPSGL